VVLFSTVVSAVSNNNIALMTIVGVTIESSVEASTNGKSEFFMVVFSSAHRSQWFRSGCGVAGSFLVINNKDVVGSHSVGFFKDSGLVEYSVFVGEDVNSHSETFMII